MKNGDNISERPLLGKSLGLGRDCARRGGDDDADGGHDGGGGDSGGGDAGDADGGSHGNLSNLRRKIFGWQPSHLPSVGWHSSHSPW